MLRKLIISAAFVATMVVAGLATTDTAEAHGGRRALVGRRPAVGTYYYYNGPAQPFYGPPIRVHSNAYDIGPYGPGYGWPYRAPVGARFYVAF